MDKALFFQDRRRGLVLAGRVTQASPDGSVVGENLFHLEVLVVVYALSIALFRRLGHRLPPSMA